MKQPTSGSCLVEGSRDDEKGMTAHWRSGFETCAEALPASLSPQQNSGSGMSMRNSHKMETTGIIKGITGYILGLFRDNGKENGSYYLGHNAYPCDRHIFYGCARSLLETEISSSSPVTP